MSLAVQLDKDAQGFQARVPVERLLVRDDAAASPAGRAEPPGKVDTRWQQ
jgi:hypothetical protein